MRPCPTCDGRGVLKIQYHDGTPFDLAVCPCWITGRMRIEIAVVLVARHYGLDVARVGPLSEWIEGKPSKRPHALQAAIQAGQTRAKL